MNERRISPVQPAEIKPPERRERISDEEMGNLLAAFGNHEAKALTLLFMNKGTIYTRTDIHSVMLRAQGSTPGWRMDRKAPFNYCFYSLAPIGLVTKEIVDPVSGVFGYEKTEYGEEIGDPLAALLLDYSLAHDTSLYQFFGITQSTSRSLESGVGFTKRSPLTRLKIFRELLSAKLPIRETDLYKRVREGQSMVRNHLESLQRLGLIDYEAPDKDQSISVYRLSASRPTSGPVPFKYHPTLTKQIYEMMSSEQDKEWTIQEIAKRISSSGNIKGGYSITSAILTYLHTQGYLLIGKFNREKHSEINLSAKKQDLAELVRLIDAFQSQGPQVLERGKQLVQRFRSGRMTREVAKLMLKAKENSPTVNSKPVGETVSIILSILEQKPSIKTSEVRDILEKEYDRKLTNHSVYAILSHARQNGVITGEKGLGGIIRWKVNPQAAKEAKLAEQTMLEVRKKMGLIP